MKKGTMLTILLLVGGGVAVERNWDTISETLGLSEFSPSRIRAMELVRDAYNLDKYRTNLEVINTHLSTSTQEIERGQWQADPKGAGVYLVRYEYKADGKPEGYHFSIDLNTLAVEQVPRRVDDGAESEPPR